MVAMNYEIIRYKKWMVNICDRQLAYEIYKVLVFTYLMHFMSFILYDQFKKKKKQISTN